MSDLIGFEDDPLDILEKQHRELAGLHATTGAALKELRRQRQELQETKQVALGANAKADRALAMIGSGPSGYTVMAWTKLQGHRPTEAWAADEGGKCRKICIRLGFAIPGRICNGGVHMARKWPYEVIKEWWPGCCRRQGWSETWILE